MRAIRALLAAGLVVASQLASACDFVPVRIAGSAGKSGNVTIEFGEPDDSRHPTGWQGPLTISTDSAPACAVSNAVSIIESPVMLAGSVLYVPTYSGSANVVYAVDAKTCAVIWRSDEFAGTTTFTTGSVIMGAKKIHVDRHCHPAP